MIVAEVEVKAGEKKKGTNYSKNWPAPKHKAHHEY